MGFPPEGKGGAVAGQEGTEWTANPEVDDAAGYAVQQLTAQSNSLHPFTLKKVLSAKAQASEEGVTHLLKLRVGQGNMPDQLYEVEVASSPRAFHLRSSKMLQREAADH